MTDSRARILQRLRRGQGEPLAEPAYPLPAREWDRAERIRRFSERLQAVRAEVHVTDAADWPELLRRLATEKGVQRIACARTGPVGGTLRAAATEFEYSHLEAGFEAERDHLFTAVDAAVTGSRAAIAETGSIVLWPDAAEPRSLSLVPPVHFVLVDADSIHDTFAELVAAQGWAGGMPTNALLISGPSKSADIEQTLAYGVHGPKELVVLLLG